MQAMQQAYAGPVLSESSFRRMVQNAVEENPGSEASMARIAAATATAAGVSGAFSPRVSLGASYGAQIIGSGSKPSNAPYVELSQLVFDAGASTNRRIAAEARLNRIQSDHIAYRSSLTFRAVETYFDVLRRRELAVLAEQNVGLHRTFLGQVETRVDAGAASETDSLVARSRLADATSLAVSRRADQSRAESLFAEVFAVVPQALPTPPDAPALTLGNLTAVAAGNPRVVGMDSAILAAEADLRAAQAGRLPTVRLGVTGRQQDSRMNVTGGISVNYALTSGGERAASILTAEANLIEAQAARRELLRELVRSMAHVQADQQARSLQLSAVSLAVSANRANAEAFLAQFEMGRRSITEVLEAQSGFIESSEGMINAETDLALSGYALLAVTGDILGVFGVANSTQGQE